MVLAYLHKAVDTALWIALSQLRNDAQLVGLISQ